MKCKKHGKLFCGECTYGKINENYKYKKDDLTVEIRRRDKIAWGKAFNEIKQMKNEE